MSPVDATFARRVSWSVADAATAGASRRASRAFLLLGVAPRAWAERARLVPTWSIPTGSGEDTQLYLVRITHSDEVDTLLPGLDQRGDDGALAPSLLRDAAHLALRAGADGVEVALIVYAGARPWDLFPEDAPSGAAAMFDHVLARKHGVLVAVPDAGGPTDLASAPPDWSGDPLEAYAAQRLDGWARDATALAARFAANDQIGVLDAPRGVDPQALDDALRPLVGRDLAVCAWSGPDDDIASHGWRPACGAVGALLAGRDRARNQEGARARSLLGRKVPIGPGRAGAARPERAFVGSGGNLLELALCPDGVHAIIEAEPSLRRPLGVWTLTAVWTARMVIEAIEAVAEKFVFRVLNPTAPNDLRMSLLEGLGIFVRGGVLASTASGRGPKVTARGPETRGEAVLYATIEAVLLPWMVEVRLQVEVMLHRGVATQLAR